MGNTPSSTPAIQQQPQPQQAPPSALTTTVSSKQQSNECPIDHTKLAKPTNSKNNSKTSSDAPPACPSSLNNSNDNNNNNNSNINNAATSAWWKSWPFITSNDTTASGASSMAPQLPPSLEEAARHAQIRQYQEQSRVLSTQRVISSIPRAATITTTEVAVPSSSSSDGDTTKQQEDPAADVAIVPPHQLNTDNPQNHWVYPSEQQFYNALRRKGWKHVPEDLIPNIVQIHNAVNEQGWRQVCYWERIFLGHFTVTETRQQLRLVQLVGRPTTKSFHVYMSNLFFPERQWFDRHDWYVDRNNGQAPRRYMLDFYEIQAPAARTAPDRHPPPVPIMYLHVRPALDSPQAVMDRFYMFVRNSFPGTALLLDQYQQYQRKVLQEKQRQQQQRQQQLAQYAASSTSSSSTTPTTNTKATESPDKTTK